MAQWGTGALWGAGWIWGAGNVQRDAGHAVDFARRMVYLFDAGALSAEAYAMTVRVVDSGALVDVAATAKTRALTLHHSRAFTLSLDERLQPLTLAPRSFTLSVPRKGRRAQ
jgi:hypothetical protein